MNLPESERTQQRAIHANRQLAAWDGYFVKLPTLDWPRIKPD